MDQVPLSRLMTTRDLIALTRLSRTSIYRMTRQGRFPPPCSMGNGHIRWREADVRAWMEGLPAQAYPPRDIAPGYKPPYKPRRLS